MSPSIYLCVGDIRAIVNRLAAGGPDSKVALLMDNNSPFLVARVRSYRASLLEVCIICNVICRRVAGFLTSYMVVCVVDMVN
jgi:hypothetical protein